MADNMEKPEVAGERTVVKERRRTSATIGRAVGVISVAGIGILIAAMFWLSDRPEEDEISFGDTRDDGRVAIGPRLDLGRFSLDEPEPKPEPARADPPQKIVRVPRGEPVTAGSVEVTRVALPGIQPQRDGATQPVALEDDTQDRLFERRTSSGIMGSRGGPSAGGSGDAGALFGGEEAPLAQQLQPTVMHAASAAVLANQHNVIPQGSMLDCVLETEIISTQPGMTRCVLSEPVYSSNGSQVLLPRSTVITGQYQRGIQHGDGRIFVLWTRARTPSGVVVALDSPGAGPLGAAGHSGYVDTKFWERIQMAVVLSIIDDSLAIAARGVGGDGNTRRTERSMSQAMGIVMQEHLDIQPVLYAMPGDHIKVMVARDLDFSAVLEAGHAVR